MYRLTEAIEKSIEHENWVAALFMTLCMPDICGAIETPDEKQGCRYRRWFNENMSEYTNKFSAEDAWHFRCILLHHGHDFDLKKKMSYERIHFIKPPSKNNIVHRNKINNVLQMQVDIFCRDMIIAVDNWYENKIKKDKELYRRSTEILEIHDPKSLSLIISL